MMHDCCWWAFKHGQDICPVCGQKIILFDIPRQLTIDFKEKQR